MNPEKQRIAIAEACGWQRVKSYDEAMPEGVWVRPGLKDFDESELGGVESLPNYLGDLNAIHEAEKGLTEYQRLEYTDRLIDWDDSEGYCDWDCAHATAARRAEAFLKTSNLWTNE